MKVEGKRKTKQYTQIDNKIEEKKSPQTIPQEDEMCILWKHAPEQEKPGNFRFVCTRFLQFVSAKRR